MENKNNNNKLSNQSCNSQLTVLNSKATINTAVVKAFARTGKQCTPEAIELITTEVTDEYGHLSITTITQALKNGGRGKYGRTYLLSVQEVFIWIDSYIKENPNEKDENYIYFQWNSDPSVMVRRVLKSEADKMFEDQEAVGYTYKIIKNIKNKNKVWN